LIKAEGAKKTMMQKKADDFLKTLDGIKYGRLALTTPDGQQRVFAAPSADQDNAPQGTLVLKDWRVVKNLLLKGDSGFLEDYRAGLWETDDLESLITVALRNQSMIAPYMFGARMMQTVSRLSQLLKLNTIAGSRRNIHAHYDLGNEFYGLWLDESMTYSSALFKSEDEDFVAAQMNKYDRIIDSFERPSGRTLEIGCGWGGFAERASDRGDFDIKSITISKAQYDFARKRLNGRADIALEDYRIQSGLYDNITSIEMFEAVGREYWDTYFSKLKSLLSQKGRAVIQTITIDESAFPTYSRRSDVIRNYIFPGGMLPTPTHFRYHAMKSGLGMTNVLQFGKDYARTLRLWLQSFEAKRHDLMEKGFDESFIRLWRFYLAGCAAGFETGRINVMQAELRHV
jgi:cyclopropane-fatty-acyl-phospholipid synthase